MGTMASVEPEEPYAELLRRLALHDEHPHATVRVVPRSLVPGLNEKPRPLARTAALIAGEGGGPSSQWAVASAIAAGAVDSEIADALVSVAPIVGAARTAAAA